MSKFGPLTAFFFCRWEAKLKGQSRYRLKVGILFSAWFNTLRFNTNHGIAWWETKLSQVSSQAPQRARPQEEPSQGGKIGIQLRFSIFSPREEKRDTINCYWFVVCFEKEAVSAWVTIRIDIKHLAKCLTHSVCSEVSSSYFNTIRSERILTSAAMQEMSTGLPIDCSNCRPGFATACATVNKLSHFPSRGLSFPVGKRERLD